MGKAESRSSRGSGASASDGSGSGEIVKRSFYEPNFGRLDAPRSDQARTAGSPFRIAVLGDFTGRANRGEVETGDALAGRKPLKVDVDDLDGVLQRLNISLRLPLGDDGAVEFGIASMDDFHPDELFEKLEIFEELSGLRRRLETRSTFEAAAREVLSWSGTGKRKKIASARRARGAVVPVGGKLDDFAQLVGRPSVESAAQTSVDALLVRVVGPHVVPSDDPQRDELVAQVDRALSATMRSILHHPDFQYLESIWRSVEFLTRRLETSARLQVVLYDISAEELAADLSRSDALEDSGLYKLLVEQPPLDDRQGALSALVGMYTFEMTPPHAELLGRMAKIASHADAPFVAALGADCLDIDEHDDLHPLIRNAWQTLRGLPEAVYLGLALPRFMLRMPYGGWSDPIDSFEFEEFTARAGLKSMLWGNPAIVVGYLLGETFAQQGGKMKLGSVMGVGDMPFYFYRDSDGDQIALPCTERLIPLRLAESVIGRNLMPLLAIQGRPEIRLGSFGSLAGPTLAGLWGGAGAAMKPTARRGDDSVQLVAGRHPAAPAPEATDEAASDEIALDEEAEDLLAAAGDSGSDLDLEGEAPDAELDLSDSDSDDDELDALLAGLEGDEEPAESEDAEKDDDGELDPELAELLKGL